MYNDQFFQQPMPLFQGYGLNASYATPAYMANFRPAYSSGHGRYNPYDTSGMYTEGRIMDSILPFPFSNNSPFNADPLSYSAALSYDVNSKAVDGGMGLAQKIGTPLAMWYLSNKVLNSQIRASSSSAAAFSSQASAFTKTLLRGEGLSAAALAARNATATHSIASGLGTALGRGMGGAVGGVGSLLSRAVGLGAAPSLVSAGAGVGGVIGGVAGGVLLPFATAIGASKVAEEMLFDPYISTRRGMDSNMVNTANQFVGGANSTVSGRFGMSHSQAYTTALKLSQSGARDFAFEQQDYNIINDYATRAGLMNSIGDLNPEQVQKRVEGMAKSVKLIMAIANTDSVKDAIDYLGKVKSMGVSSPTVAANVMRQIGGASAISGSSVDQIMNTIGAQSQFMFQQRGMLPVLGQLAGAATYAGFANAYKTGFISSATMSSIGGVEGASQNLMEGSLNILNRPNAIMSVMTGRSLSSDLVGTLSEFGQRAATNPMGLAGDIALNKDYLMSKAIQEKGIDRATYDAFIQGLGDNINVLGKTGGKVDIQKFAGMLAGSGISEEQIRAMITRYKSLADISTQVRATDARFAQITRTGAQVMNQEGMNFAGTGMGRAWYEVKADFKDVMADYITPFASTPAGWIASLSDASENIGNYFAGIESPYKRREIEVDKKTGVETGYQVRGRKRNTDFERRSDHSMSSVAGAVGRMAAGSGTTDAMSNSETNARIGESLFRQAFAMKDANTDQGRMAKIIFDAMQNKGEGVDLDKLSDTLYKFDKSVNGVTLSNVNLKGNTTAGRSVEVARMIKGGELYLEKSTRDMSRSNSELLRNITSNAAKNSFWEKITNTGTGGDPRFQTPGGYSKEEGEYIGKNILGVLSGMTEDQTSAEALSSQIMGGSKEYAEAEAALKAGKALTNRQKEILRRPEIYAKLSGVDKKKIQAAMSGGEGTVAHKEMIEAMSKKSHIIDESIADVMKDTLKNANRDQKSALIYDISKGDSMVAEALEGNGILNLIQNRATWKTAGTSIVKESKVQSKAQGQDDSMGKNLRDNTVGLDTAMKDMNDIVQNMSSFGNSIGSSADKFSTAAGDINKASKALTEGVNNTMGNVSSAVSELNNQLKDLNKALRPAGAGGTQSSYPLFHTIGNAPPMR